MELSVPIQAAGLVLGTCVKLFDADETPPVGPPNASFPSSWKVTKLKLKRWVGKLSGPYEVVTLP